MSTILARRDDAVLLCGCGCAVAIKRVLVTLSLIISVLLIHRDVGVD